MRALSGHALAQVAAALAMPCANAQAPFALDTAFRTAIQDQYVNSLLPLPDGKLLISGAIRFPGDMSVRAGARLNPDGSRDASFPDLLYMGGRIEPWMDRIYVRNGPGLRRMFYSGALDPAFNMVGTPYFSAFQGGDYHVFPDGRVLMSGSHTVNYPAGGYSGLHQLIWFTNTGYLDTTRVHRKGNGTVFRFRELPDGKFICSGFATQFDGQPVDRIFRVHADGAVDTTFSTGVSWGLAQSYLPLPDGRVYLGGRYTLGAAPNDTLRLARFDSDGSMDMAFTPPQFTLGALPNNGGLGAQVLRVRSWGPAHIMATGHFQFVNGQPRRGICVLDTTGALTPDFDDCGIGPFTHMGITNGSISGLMPDTDSTHYYVWGTYAGYSDGTTNDPLQRFVSRLHVGDFTTGASHAASASSFLLYPNPSSGSATLQLEHVPPDAQLVLRDALGREVLRRRVSDHYTSLQLNAFTDGLYAVELLSNGERMGTQRLVLQR
jgi:uncharacterized delta-60 repeat protein